MAYDLKVSVTDILLCNFPTKYQIYLPYETDQPTKMLTINVIIDGLNGIVIILSIQPN